MPTGGSGTRIAHLIERYSLVGMGADLESRWSHTDVEAESQEALDALTNYFNSAIVRTVFARVGAEPPEHSAEDVYQLLTVDDPPAGDEAAVREWLTEHGVDPDELTADFVSRREMHRYLRDVRGLEVPLRLTHPPDVAERHDITTEDLERRIEAASDPRQEDRLAFVRQLYAGTNVPDAADAVGYEPSTGYRWLAAWEAGGVDGLLTDRPPGYQKLTPHEERQFVRRLAGSDRWTTADIQDLLIAEFDVTYSDRHLHRKLRAYGLETVSEIDAYRWPADAPDEPAARCASALDDVGLLNMGTDDVSDTTV